MPHLFAQLCSNGNRNTSVWYDFSSPLYELAEEQNVDAFIVSTADGFSPLGRARHFISIDLGINEEDIRRLANWNQLENLDVSLIGLKSQNQNSNLRGVVLAAGENSRCYERFATPFYGRPYRDFYYNVAYESISYAAKILGAKNIAMSHLSGGGNFHEDIATCILEALGHFCDIVDNPPICSFGFVGCCINQMHLNGIMRLNAEDNVTVHRNIRTQTELRDGYEVISFDWR